MDYDDEGEGTRAEVGEAPSGTTNERIVGRWDRTAVVIRYVVQLSFFVVFFFCQWHPSDTCCLSCSQRLNSVDALLTPGPSEDFYSQPNY